jgi:hypothetical protein
MILFGNYCGINRLEGVLHRPFKPAGLIGKLDRAVNFIRSPFA